MEYKKKAKKQKGVTLVGVLVGITILSIALAAQIRLLGNTIRRDAELRSLIIATNLAREGVEILFSWRVTEGWKQLMDNKSILCTDIRVGTISESMGGNNCLTNIFRFTRYDDGEFSSDNYEAYLYDSTPSKYDIPPFWRVMTVRSCNSPDDDDAKCLILVSTSGWESCDPAKWAECVSSTGTCDCKLVKLEKKIYNWYVP